jgi:tetraacyldisaccharide-1-P 4'-kinase
MLLPAGPLRDTYRSADKADLCGGFADDWRHNRPNPKLLIEYVPTHLVSRIDNGDHVPIPLKQYRGTPVHLVSGIARHVRFEKTVGNAGFTIAGKSVFKDHHRFNNKDGSSIALAAQASGAKIILTTEKDLVRMPDFALGLPLFALLIELKLVSGADVLKDALISLGIR